MLEVAPVPTSADVTVVFGPPKPSASAVPAAPPRTSCPILTLKVAAELLEKRDGGARGIDAGYYALQRWVVGGL